MSFLDKVENELSKDNYKEKSLKKSILFVLGTRPEVIKVAPVIIALKKNPLYNVIVCNTEQQKELSNQTLDFFDIKADVNLDVMRCNQSLSETQSRILNSISNIFECNKIDATIVQGDTMSAFCGALASFYNKVPIFHIEAGLRSYNLFEPFPEEALRQMISRIADLHFAPTQGAFEALIQEKIPQEKIVLTGNTVIDALSCLSNDTIKEAKENLIKKGVTLDNNLVLITAHRRENHGKRLDHILDAIVEIVRNYKDHQFVIPVHPNPNVHDKIYQALNDEQNVVLTNPLDYPELVLIMKNTKLILTDSGGIQEEAPSFGNPVLVLRYKTERNEGVELGFAKLVGADKDKIVDETKKILNLNKELTRVDSKKNPYGDGFASERISKAIDSFFNNIELINR